MVRKPPQQEQRDRLYEGLQELKQGGQAVARWSKQARWRFVGVMLYFYAAMFAFGTLGTLASSGFGPALLAAACTYGLFYAGQRCMAKAREVAALG